MTKRPVLNAQALADLATLCANEGRLPTPKEIAKASPGCDPKAAPWLALAVRERLLKTEDD